eukprot:COSAG06_NODE_717_length_12831_cov_52.780003_14_plen_45_part_00
MNWLDDYSPRKLGNSALMSLLCRRSAGAHSGRFLTTNWGELLVP